MSADGSSPTTAGDAADGLADARHDPDPAAASGSGLRASFALLTAWPVGAGTLDRVSAARAIRWAPAVGLVLGSMAAVLIVTGRFLELPSALTGTLAVAALAAATRALHLDGLADTADALGSGLEGEAARAVMKRSDIGPFGVVAVTLTLLVQATTLGALPVPFVVLAVATGRVAVLYGCRIGVRPAAGSGMGSLVARSTSPWSPVIWTLAFAAAPLPLMAATGALGGAIPEGLAGHEVAGYGAWLVALAAGVGASEAVRRRASARVGGITGDILGACCEVAVTVTACVGLVVTTAALRT